MPEYEVNKAAVDMAKRRIDDGKYDRETEWSDAAPSTDEGNSVIEEAGYDEYGSWHLGIDTSASDETKDRFGFPYGDFSKVNRAALIHAKQRASQNDHDQIVDAADEVLQHLDEVSSGLTSSSIGPDLPRVAAGERDAMNSNDPTEAETGGEQLRIGDCYEFTHGPASAPERTMRGVLEDIDNVSNTYTFRLGDDSTVSLVDHEVDGVRLVPGGC